MRTEKIPILFLFYQIDERHLVPRSDRDFTRTLEAIGTASTDEAKAFLRDFVATREFRQRAETIHTLLRETRATYTFVERAQGLQAYLFENLGALDLQKNHYRNESVLLTPQDTDAVYKYPYLHGKLRFKVRAEPDGLVFRIRGNKSLLVGVAEYTAATVLTPERKGKQILEYETLSVVDDLLDNQNPDWLERLGLLVHSRRPELPPTIGFNANDFQAVIYVPEDCVVSRRIPFTQRVSIVKSPVSFADLGKFSKALATDVGFELPV